MARIKRGAHETPIPEKILSASMKVFGAIGYEAASMKEIAKEAGVTAAALYYHYTDKRELLAKGLEAIARSVRDATHIDSAEIKADPVQALDRYVINYISYQISEIRTVAPMYTSLVHGMQRKGNSLTAKQIRVIRDLEQEHVDKIREILDEGRRQGLFSFESPTITAFAIIGMCEHTLTWVNPEGKTSVREIAKYFASLVRKMVAATKAN